MSVYPAMLGKKHTFVFCKNGTQLLHNFYYLLYFLSLSISKTCLLVFLKENKGSYELHGYWYSVIHVQEFTKF